MSEWQRLDSKIVYQNPDLTVNEDRVITPIGKAVTYGWIETAPTIQVIALEAKDKVLLVQSSRYTTGQLGWELPSAGTDGEDALGAAKTLLAQTANRQAQDWDTLHGEFYAWPKIGIQRNTILVASKLSLLDPVDAPVRTVTIEAFTWTALKSMIADGQINDFQTIAALTIAGLHLKHLK